MVEPNHALLWAGRSTLLLLLILADLANGLALAALWCRPAVRSPSNRFVVSLLIANLLGCGALVPLQLLDTSFENVKTVRPVICACGEAIASSFCAASILSVLLIVADQYRAVSSPLHYHTPSVFSGGAAICSVWLVTALIGAGGAVTSAQQNTLWVSCGSEKTASSSVRITFAVIFGLLVIAVPFAALCWLYTAICNAARGNEERARRCSTVSSSGTGDGVVSTSQSVPAISAETVEPESGTLSGSATEEAVTEVRRHSCPVPARFRRRLSLTIEARAARVSVAVAAMALLCWTPFAVILALHAVMPSSPPPMVADQMAFAALAASAIVSPWLFAYRSRRLRLEIIAVPRRMSRFQVLGSPL